MQNNIPQGARCLKPKMAAEKCGRRDSWLWAKLKTDPTFPRPIYLSRKAPVFLEHELDAWLARQAEQSRKTV